MNLDLSVIFVTLILHVIQKVNLYLFGKCQISSGLTDLFLFVQTHAYL